jgi:hypothetical protein
MLRGMPQGRTVTPGHVVTYPNRDKASSHVVRLIVVLLLVISAALMLAITFGGWSKLQGLKPVNFVWSVIYLIIAFYIIKRWARGLLPIAAALAILLLITAVIAGTGASGTSWFNRSNFGFAQAQSLFGGTGLGANTLGSLTILLIPVQALLIFFSMFGFAQGWNVELEVPEDEVNRRGHRPKGSPPPQPANA